MMTGPHGGYHKLPLICLVRRPSTTKRLRPTQLRGRILHLSSETYVLVCSIADYYPTAQSRVQITRE